MDATPHHCPAEKRKFVLIVAILASAMGFIDGSVVAVALPQIRSALGADFTQAQWISNAYMLFLSALILLGGALGDRFGLRTVFGIGISLFTIASVACAFAWDANSLIAFRAFQGVGAAAMIPGSMAIIAKNTPRDERGKAMGIWVAASSITTAMGPLLGGVLLTFGGPEVWRWIFAINLPVGLFALFILRTKVPRDLPSQEGGFLGIDWLGAVLVTGALGLMAAGLTFLGEVDGSSMAFILLVAGVAVAIAAICWELRRADPMVELRLFASLTFSGANALTFLTWSSIGAMVFFMPMVVIVAWQMPPSYAGGMFVPFSVVIALLSPFSGRLVDRYGTRALLTIGSAVVGFASIAMAWAVVKQDYWTGVLPALLLLGIGIGLLASPLSTAIVNAVSDRYSGAASGINNMIARMSNLFAIAGLGAFVSYVYVLIMRGSKLDPEIQDLMIEAGFGERLTGALYQISTVELQATGMNHAMIALCIVLMVMAFISAAIGWFTQG